MPLRRICSSSRLTAGGGRGCPPLQAILAEIDTLTHVRHPHLALVLGADIQRGCVRLVLELAGCEGYASLHDLVRDHKRHLSTSLGLHLAVQVAGECVSPSASEDGEEGGLALFETRQERRAKLLVVFVRTVACCLGFGLAHPHGSLVAARSSLCLALLSAASPGAYLLGHQLTRWCQLMCL